MSTSTAITAVPLLAARELRKTFGERIAVDGVSLEIRTGEILGLLGPNGAGKTTTMSMICGLLEPDGGHVEIEGHPAGGTSARRVIGVVPQELALYPDLTAAENVRFFGALYGLRGRELRERTNAVLETAQLAQRADDFTHTLSGGMKRRLNLAVGVVHAPRLLVLDEPTVGVDPQSRHAILDTLRALAETGVGILVASHHMHEIETLCDRVAIMDHGRILVDGAINEVLRPVASEATVVIEEPGSEEPPAETNGWGDLVDGVVTRDGRCVLELRSADGADLVLKLTRLLERLADDGRTVVEIHKLEPNLERLFLNLTGRALRD